MVIKRTVCVLFFQKKICVCKIEVFYIILYTGSSPDSTNRPEIVDNMVKTLQSKVAQTTEKVSALQEFQLYVREGDSSYIKRNFKYVTMLQLTRILRLVPTRVDRGDRELASFSSFTKKKPIYQ